MGNVCARLKYVQTQATLFFPLKKKLFHLKSFNLITSIEISLRCDVIYRSTRLPLLGDALVSYALTLQVGGVITLNL